MSRIIGAMMIALSLLGGASMLRAQPTGGNVTPPGAPKALTPAEEKAADMRLPSLDRSAFTPESRIPVEVEEDEKSPFADVYTAGSGFVAKQPVTEEKRIRELLAAMRVSGLAGSPGAYRALIGPISVAKGDTLPPLFAGQAEVLRVKDVTERALVIEFVESGGGGAVEPERREETGAATSDNLLQKVLDAATSLVASPAAEDVPTQRPSRTIGLPISLVPRVDSLLAGEMLLKLLPLDGEGSPILEPRKNPAAEAIAQTLEAQGMESMVDRPTEMLNAPATVEKSDEKAKEQ
jgi:hypothetical protein